MKQTNPLSTWIYYQELSTREHSVTEYTFLLRQANDCFVVCTCEDGRRLRSVPVANNC